MWLPLTEGLKSRLRRHPAYGAWQRMKEDRALGRWARSTTLETPPSVFKQHVVREYAHRFGTCTRRYEANWVTYSLRLEPRMSY